MQRVAALCVVPYGTPVFLFAVSPALKRWANLHCAYGAVSLRFDSSVPLGRLSTPDSESARPGNFRDTSGKLRDMRGEFEGSGHQLLSASAVSIPYSLIPSPLDYPLCRMCITSPSCTMYSLPSSRSVPLARAAASEPAASSASQRMVSARIKWCSKSE